MNIMKKFLILGNTLCFIISCNASDSNNVNLLNRNVLVSGILELSNHDTIINKSLEVQNNNFGTDEYNTIAELRLGKSNAYMNTTIKKYK